MGLNCLNTTLLCTVLALGTGRANAQLVEQVLRSIGYPSPKNPYAGLIQGRSGDFYGTTYNGGTNGYGVVFKLSGDGAICTTLHSFTGPDADGANPYAGVIQGNDGALYGTTYGGGSGNLGVVFKLSTDGSTYTKLHNFSRSSGDGANPHAALIQGNDGSLYGTTSSGGTGNLGVVFKLSTDGSTYTTLHSFGGFGSDGANPYAALIQGNDGSLYGTTLSGGANDDGTLFKLNTNGTDYTLLYSFSGTAGDGNNPYAGLVQAIDGTLYGTTSGGGIFGHGVVFNVTTNGAGYNPLYSFDKAHGWGPAAGLLQGNDGALYGTTSYGGDVDYGVVFKLSTDGTGFATLHSFVGTGMDGAYPYGALAQGSDGVLYGITYRGGISDDGTVFKLRTNGTSYTVLCSFDADGVNPFAGLVQGSDGAFYGTTYFGGINDYGIVFKLNADGASYSALYRFTAAAWDGRNPYAGLMQGSDGALYGTTYGGGTNGYGMVFKVNPSGTSYTVLYSFGTSADGRNPYGSVMQGNDGALYGTTYGGGTNGYGVVFKLNTNGTAYSRLYSFSGTGGDGRNPYAGLVQGSDGALYGTTYEGGSNNCGTVFKLSTNGAGYRRLHSFSSTGGDGRSPYAGVVQGSDGALYGTTYGGGTYNSGTVFKLNTDGTGYTQLYSFVGTNGDGRAPGRVTQGNDGYLYGTTLSGGTNGYGMVFRLSTNGSGYARLYSFSGTGGDGANPYGGVVQGSDGALYGSTFGGGAYGYGTLFRLLAPPFPLQLRILPDNKTRLSTLTVSNVTLQFTASSDLLNWSPLTNIEGMAGMVEVDDLAATNYSRRFYRAVWTH